MLNRNVSEAEMDLRFLIEKAKILSSSFEEQEKQLGFLGDYITDDIANDWDWGCLCQTVNNLLEKNVISEETKKLFVEIDKRFDEVSRKGKLFSHDIWTLDGLKKHSFWEKQRQIAQTLLKMLEEAKLNR